MRRSRRQPLDLLALASLCGLAGGCAGPGAEDAERLARALAARVALHYDQRLAAAQRLDPPAREEIEEAHEELNAALRAADLPALEGQASRDPSADAVAAARNLLLREGYVFPPPAPAPGGPGLILARVRSRRAGLTRVLWGETLRYRRVLHATPLLHDFVVHASLRTGQGPLPPLARWTDRTVFLDEDALARRAGHGPYAGFSARELAEHLELQQVATLQVAKRIGLEDFAAGAAPVVRDALARVWLTLLVEGDLTLTERRLRAELARGRGPWAAAAAFVLARCPLQGPASEIRARALRVYQALLEGALVVPAAAGG